MRSKLAISIQGWVGLALVALVTVAPGARAQQADAESLSALFSAMKATGADELPRLHQTAEGYVRYVGAPAGGYFTVPEDAAKSASMEVRGQAFFEAYGSAFGVTSDAVSFTARPARDRNGFNYVRLDQRYGGIPVFGGQAIVALNAAGDVQQVTSDILRDTRVLDQAGIRLQASISAAQASTAARTAVAGDYEGVTVQHLGVKGAAALMIYDPSLLGQPGDLRLVWRMRVGGESPVRVLEEVLVDAHSGAVALHFTLLHDALDRTIFDANGGNRTPTSPARIEGGPATGIADVDNTYEFLADTYDFYLQEHGRDGIDNDGLPLVVTVRLPLFNAFWTPDEMTLNFGTGLAVDDIVAHEYTHGVTQFESDLIYFGFSGAINESLSDVWGEFVDLTNGAGNDADDVRWLLGEDITAVGEGDPSETKQQRTDTLAFRSMSDPTIFGDPDRLGSPLLFDVTSFIDNGGVHINSGIGNKLCYLLTDGGEFNGQTVEAMGIPLVADLFYQAQLMLTPTSDYFDLYNALAAGSVALGLTFEERLNILRAGRAVEIEPADAALNGLRAFRATPAFTTSGNPVIALTWKNPPADQFQNVQLIRQLQGFAQTPEEGTLIFQGTSEVFVDRTVQSGIEYFYTLIADLNEGFPQILFAKALGGGDAPIVHTEAFGGLGGGQFSDFDLSFRQILYTPVGAPVAGSGGGGLADYEATIVNGVTSLPIPRGSGANGSFALPLTYNTNVFLPLVEKRFPFFGTRYNQLVLNSNGYISFAPLPLALTLPTTAAHFQVPRISFLFANLLPIASSDLWAKPLDDRYVITFNRIAEAAFAGPFTGSSTSTAQVELFYSGHIRITYQSVGVDDVIVGISDGQGVPINPADIADDLLGTATEFDLSTLGTVPARLSLNTVTPVSVTGGETAAFDITARIPAGQTGIPVLTATWDGPGPVPFGDLRNGTGRFSWPTNIVDEGEFTVRVIANLNGARTFQDVQVLVGQFAGLPSAMNLRLSTGTPLEDPTMDRTVDDNVALFADYQYTHPLLSTANGVTEGPSLLYWFKNGQVVTSLTNNREVPASATQPGDQWHFRVLPLTQFGIAGPIASSPFVTVLGGFKILSVSPPAGVVEGGDTVRIVGERIEAPIKIEFGGVRVTSVRNLGNSILEVVTPVHNAGPVDVIVHLANGTARKANAFTYVDGDTLDGELTDINNDGVVNALDVQLVVEAIMRATNGSSNRTDVNIDGATNSADVQMVINRALGR